MNLFEAGVLPAIPIGAIAGGVLCAPYGLAAVVGGVLAGGVAGGFAGLLYGSLVVVLVACFEAFWAIKRGESEPPESEVMAITTQTAMKATVYSVVLGGLLAFGTRWYIGLTYIVFSAVFISFFAVCKGRSCEKKDAESTARTDGIDSK